MSDEFGRRMDDHWPMWIYRAMIGLVCGFMLIGFVVVTRNTIELYRVAHELVDQTARLNIVIDQQNILKREVATRLDEIEKTLFGDLIAKLDKKSTQLRPAEMWQVNRDRELRQMIRGLQDFRLRIENQVKTLQDDMRRK